MQIGFACVCTRLTDHGGANVLFKHIWVVIEAILIPVLLFAKQPF